MELRTGSFAEKNGSRRTWGGGEDLEGRSGGRLDAASIGSPIPGGVRAELGGFREDRGWVQPDFRGESSDEDGWQLDGPVWSALDVRGSSR